MMKLIITPEEIALYARPCYVDEKKAEAYIYEAEMNNIKPVLGDSLYIRAKNGELPVLLEGGEYSQGGELRYMAGLKRALAYYAYSRLMESSSLEMTRQGVVVRQSEYSNDSEREERIAASRETYAIADRYMNECVAYLIAEGEMKNAAVADSRRSKIMVIGDKRTSKSCSVFNVGSTGGSASGGGGENAANINIVHTTGHSTKDVMSQYAVTREIEGINETIASLKEEFDEIEIPDTSGLETKSDAQSKLREAKDYTDSRLASLEIPDDFYTRREVDSKLEVKADKISVIVRQASGNVTLAADKRYLVTMTGDIVFTLAEVSDGYAHSYEIDLIVGATAYSVAFPNDVVWVKDIEIEANSRYMISIDYNGSTYTAMYAKIGG